MDFYQRFISIFNGVRKMNANDSITSENDVMSDIESAVNNGIATVDAASVKLKELVKLANFDVEGIWGDAVDAAKTINSDTNAVKSAASDSLDEFDRLGRVLKIFGHDVEGIWDTLVSVVKKHA